MNRTLWLLCVALLCACASAPAPTPNDTPKTLIEPDSVRLPISAVSFEMSGPMNGEDVSITYFKVRADGAILGRPARANPTEPISRTVGVVSSQGLVTIFSTPIEIEEAQDGSVTKYGNPSDIRVRVNDDDTLSKVDAKGDATPLPGMTLSKDGVMMIQGRSLQIGEDGVVTGPMAPAPESGVTLQVKGATPKSKRMAMLVFMVLGYSVSKVTSSRPTETPTPTPAP